MVGIHAAVSGRCATLMPYDVFLSHNSGDKPAVRCLAERLRAAGLEVWLDEWVIKPGDDIYLAIERGLQESQVQVLCLSALALGSDWVTLERSTVLFRDPSNAGRRFIPLLLADCDLPDTLRRYKHVDYRTESDAAFAELLAACRPAETPATVANQPSRGRPPRLGAVPRPGAPPRSVAEAPSGVAFERSLIGHTGWVTTLALAPDGSWFASGSDDKTVKTWDMESGDCTGTYLPNCGEVRTVIVAPDGRIVIGGNNGTVVVWRPGTQRASLRIKAHPDQVRGLTALDDGGLLTGGFGTELKVWDLQKGVCLKRIDVGATVDDHVFCASAGRTEGEAITAHRDGTIRLWDLEAGECTKRLLGHAELVNAVAVMPDGRHAVSASGDHTIRIWDLEIGTCIGALEGHRTRVVDVDISPNGSLIASTGFTDHTARLWDWRNGACVAEIHFSNNKSPYSVRFTPDGTRLVVGTADDTIEVYKLDMPVLGTSPRVNSRHYVNAKVVLVGQSGVGKSTLAHRLVEDRYVKTDSTHGMNVWPLELPLPANALEREALLWDLAGQEDYRLTHQLFLPDTALALFVINPQADDPFVEAIDWVKALRMAATAAGREEEAAKLLIASRIDVGGVIVSQAKIDQFLREHRFQDYLATSALRGDNCSDAANGGKPSALKQLIARHIPWENLAWTSTHNVLAELKNAAMRMGDSEDIRLIRFAELSQRLEQALPGEVFDESDVRTAVTLLANQGLARALKFGDLVLLRPDLLSGYAGAIIRAARAHRDEIGCVAEEDLFGDDFDFTGVDRLRRADEELLLRALIQTLLDHALCIREREGGQTLLIFPSQYRRDREIPAHPNVFVTYSFSGELQTIYATLVVRLWHGGTFGRKELWRNAAEFTTSKGDTVGILFERLGDGEGRLSVFFDPAVPDELKVVFIEFVHRHLRRYAQDLERRRRYVCTCGEAITDMAAVQKRMAARHKFIRCQHCDKRVVFEDHIEERLGSSSALRQVAELDQQATRVLDNQAREQVLIGHMMAICGEANQIFRELARPDYGIDGEVEFRAADGRASGKKIYVQLKSGASYLSTRKDGREIFDVKDPRHLGYWVSQPVDVYLVIRDGEGVIRWMNLSRYLRERTPSTSRQIVFDGEKLDFDTVWRLRDHFIPPPNATRPPH
jgi:GTPase SAR1 family protein